MTYFCLKLPSPREGIAQRKFPAENPHGGRYSK